MAKEAETAKEAEVQLPKMNIVAQYIRDMSFENISAQNNKPATSQPDINVGVNLDAKKLGDTAYEVVMKLNIGAKAGEDTVFLLELEYGGTFNIENVPDDQIHPFLMIECPRMLFPYVRRIVSDVTRDGGYPPLNVDNIDFVALYRNEIQRRAQDAAAAAGKPN